MMTMTMTNVRRHITTNDFVTNDPMDVFDAKDEDENTETTKTDDEKGGEIESAGR